jgi:DNA-binding MurR/RpiR family transcriptional regulator
VFEPRRATAALVQLLTRARSLGTQVAAFTDEHPPGIIAESDFVFRTKVDAISVFDSYAAMFALCDALLAALVLHVPRAVRARAERLEELNDSLATWYPPRGAPPGDASR